MGERKGQNLYYPPDYDPRAGGLNAWLGTHALRERARKRHLGVLIVRFEMPFNMWCDTCGNHIGMGVRYNAEKKKVGDYYTTPVYNFRMKCHLCDGYIEIETDPGALEYRVVLGGRRQESRWDPTDNGQVVADAKETQRLLADHRMFRLEHARGDAGRGAGAAPALADLAARNAGVWRDDYAANAALRQRLRNNRAEAERKTASLSAPAPAPAPALAASSRTLKLKHLTRDTKRLKALSGSALDRRRLGIQTKSDGSGAGEGSGPGRPTHTLTQTHTKAKLVADYSDSSTD